jgi:hypothetical protein
MCLHLVVVVGLMRLCDPESNAGGSLTTMPVRSKDRVQAKRDTLVLQVAMGLTTPSCKNIFFPETEEWRLVVEEAKAHSGL